MKRQTVKLNGNTGSLVNYIYGNNATAPEVGKGATIMHFTDRSAVEVIEVSADGKTVILENLKATRVDKNGMSDNQEYSFEPTGYRWPIVWRNGAWRREITQIFLTDEAAALPFEQLRDILYENGSYLPTKVVEGLSYVKKSYPKISIVFGFKQAYHDFSF